MQVTGNTAVLNDINSSSYYNSGNSIGFQVPGNQTHGLMTNWSQGHENGHIHLVLLAHGQYFRGIVFNGITLTVLGWDRKKAWRY